MPEDSNRLLLSPNELTLDGSIDEAYERIFQCIAGNLMDVITLK